jgi:hypothetical protein
VGVHFNCNSFCVVPFLHPFDIAMARFLIFFPCKKEEKESFQVLSCMTVLKMDSDTIVCMIQGQWLTLFSMILFLCTQDILLAWFLIFSKLRKNKKTKNHKTSRTVVPKNDLQHYSGYTLGAMLTLFCVVPF